MNGNSTAESTSSLTYKIAHGCASSDGGGDERRGRFLGGEEEEKEESDMQFMENRTNGLCCFSLARKNKFCRKFEF